MGYYRHHAIIVSSWNKQALDAAHTQAIAAFSPICPVSDVANTPLNGFASFAVFTDGSKEGWDTSDDGDSRRAGYVAWLRKQSSLDWVEVQYADDELQTRVVDDSDADERKSIQEHEDEHGWA